MDLRDTDPPILLKIEGRENIAAVMKPDDVLALIRAAKLLHGQRERLRAALEEIVPLDIHHGETSDGGEETFCGPCALIAKRALGR